MSVLSFSNYVLIITIDNNNFELEVIRTRAYRT